ncbi:MAG TPA: D-2-hydroxyacid dehydrogenase family protein [Acidimicrobiales bacterium]|nr:D-2-hydroxyacid dehydrogenase family protein [Acidimicrobiales bacterium]
MTRIVVLDDYQFLADELGDWDRLGEEFEVDYLHRHLEGEPLLAAIGDAEVVVAMRERTAFPRELLERLSGLRLLVTTGMANAAIDLEAATALGITVCGTASGSDGTVELTWALILAAVKQLRREDAAMRRGAWQEHLSGDLKGATLGLIGLGRLGGAMVPIAKAFGMEVVAWSQNLTAERAAEAGARLVTKEELLGAADVVSIHLKLGDRSRGLIGAAELAQMRRSAYLVNTSRGPIVDEQALVEALRGNAIAGAALDVYDVEPLPADHPLLALDNVVLTPHLGYASEANFAHYFADIVDDIVAFATGSPVRVLAAP